MIDKTPRNDKKASKFLSYVLRHNPDKIGITLDDNGYVSVKELISALKATGWAKFTRQDLDRIVETNNKKRFAYSPDKLNIRASQGHSIEVNLNLEPVEPPEFLFHGTVDKFIEEIKQNGLQKRSRHHVHLSKDQETATSVGSRRGKPRILTIRAGEMHRAGHNFFLSANEVWLADEVPVEFIIFPN